jgi:hypothetical protein
MNRLKIEFNYGLKLGLIIGSSISYTFTTLFITSKYKLTPIKNNTSL